MNRGLPAHLLAFDFELPLERARTIPSSWYVDPEIYAAERRTVFEGAWLAAGRIDQLREPGSFFTLTVADEPILVLRDEEGSVRAFYNVCRHRAARVVPEAEGRATRLRCPYHGWTYDLMGRLRGVPEFEGVADFCREENVLKPLAAATWGPFVWIHSGPVKQSLDEYLAPLPQQLASLDLDSLRFVERRVYDVACNWKVFVDNYLDGGYHVNSVHQGLAGVLDYAQYRTEVAGNTAVQTSPLLPADASAGGVANVRAGDAAHYWWIFPNFMLNVYAGVMDTNLVLPLGQDRCRVVFDFYFANTDGPETQRFIKESIAVAHQIQLEDVGICEDVQRGLASRSYETGRYSVRREIAVHHFHRLLARRLGICNP